MKNITNNITKKRKDFLEPRSLLVFVLLFLSSVIVATAQVTNLPPPTITLTPTITNLPPPTVSVPYGSIPGTKNEFQIEIDPDVWTQTTPNSFIVSGTIKALVTTHPYLSIAYGVDPNNLTDIKPLYDGPLNVGDVVPFKTSDKIITSKFTSTLKDNTIYFSVVDKNNPAIAYTGIQGLNLVANTGATTYGIQKDKPVTAPDLLTEDNGGILDGICADVHTCGFNDLIRLVSSFWKFIIILIVPLVAIMTAWIGYNFMQNGAEYREKAKGMVSNMIMGILLVLFAWFIVNTILYYTIGKDSCYNFLGKGKISENCPAK